MLFCRWYSFGDISSNDKNTRLKVLRSEEPLSTAISRIGLEVGAEASMEDNFGTKYGRKSAHHYQPESVFRGLQTDWCKKKIHVVSDYEGRSINRHIPVLIRRDIEQYEKEHGKIEVDKE